MKDVATFYAELAESRRREQALERTGFVKPPDLSLPIGLEIAMKNRWMISPVMACSVLADYSARVGYGSAERDQIEYWYVRHARTNWLLHTGESDVVALEIDFRVARHCLAYLASDDCSWQRTLHLAKKGRWQYLFACETDLPSLDERYCGLSLHSGKASILLPPSRTLTGVEIAYADQYAQLLPAPEWLFEAVRLDQAEHSSSHFYQD